MDSMTSSLFGGNALVGRCSRVGMPSGSKNQTKTKYESSVVCRRKEEQNQMDAVSKFLSLAVEQELNPPTASEAIKRSRRSFISVSVGGLVMVACNPWLPDGPAAAAAVEAESSAKPSSEAATSPLENLLSVFEPNVTTKSGRVIPKGFAKSANDVVKSLRESVSQDPGNNLKFRRAAESARDAIRSYLGEWKGNPAVVNEESYIALESSLRVLSQFYISRGPQAKMPEEIKEKVLNLLSVAEEAL